MYMSVCILQYAVCFRDTHLFYPQVPSRLHHFVWNQLPEKQVNCPGMQLPEYHFHLLISRQAMYNTDKSVQL